MYDNNEWAHKDEEEIIEAASTEEACKLIKDRSGYDYEYIVTSIKEV
jgi:hypothetical protein